MVKSDIFKAQNTILSAAIVLAVATGINAVLGFVKSRVLTANFGTSTDLAMFYTADRIPNLIYSVLVLGALSTIFIPVFTQEYKKNKQLAWKTASSMINSSLIFFIVMGVVFYLFSYQIISLQALGKFSPEYIALGSNMMRIMLAAQLILVISSFFTSILQSFKYFLIPALAPIVYNLGVVFGTLLLAPKFGIYGPVFGVLIGATLHLLIQIPAMIKTDFRFSFSLNFKDKGIRDIFALMPPRIISVLIANVISTVNNSLAILVSATSVIYLKFAGQLQFFPVNLFGISIASAVLPTLSAETDDPNYKTFKKTFLTSLHQMFYLVIPISVILLVLRVPVVRLVYGVSRFPWEATVKTSYALAFYSISIFAESAVYILTRAFYALKDTKTPVLVSGVTIVINVLLSLLFIKVFGFGVWSVAFSFSITSIIDMLAMLYLLSKRVGGFGAGKLLIPFVKISYAAAVMGVCLYLPLKTLDEFVFDTTRTFNLMLLTGIAGALGMTAYLFFTKLFKVEEIELFYKLIRRLTPFKTEKVVPIEEVSQ
ncbi:MAG: hypothetical protein ACD_22C00100G0007 [uncultured bacterium]|nr:MAG: hypothetical protein ACD_22C00100G0007 [uncultured bacterium]